MSAVRKSITLTEKQDTWVKSLIERGDYTNESEYFRDLIRRDQEARGGVRALRAALQAGIDSGPHPGDAVADIRAALGLPPRNG